MTNQEKREKVNDALTKLQFQYRKEEEFVLSLKMLGVRNSFEDLSDESAAIFHDILVGAFFG